MLILASASPRRRDLLTRAGYTFRMVPAQVEETFRPHMTPDQIVRSLAEKKAAAVANTYHRDVVIGADTMICLDGDVLGKPHSFADAAAMLRRLSGRTHTVYTGCCIQKGALRESFSSRTDVTFFPLTEQEITGYLLTREPLDKAGAYGIQGIGGLFIEKICGDYYSVVGLPMGQLVRRLVKYLD